MVTGASKGLGAASARILAAGGTDLVLTARNEESLRALASELHDQYGVRAVTCAADLTEVEAAPSIVQTAEDAFSRIDILINSAGASQGGEFWKIPDSVWEDSLALKFLGTIRMIRAVIPKMREQRYGRIVNIVGNTGRQPNPRMLPGAAANAALLAVTKGLADEVAPDGVVINAINPGPTRTERLTTLISNIAESSGRSVVEVEADFVEDVPMQRFGEPEEIARLVVFLASDAASNMTGTSLTADGGWTKALA